MRVRTHGSAINRSVSFTILFGNTAMIPACELQAQQPLEDQAKNKHARLDIEGPPSHGSAHVPRADISWVTRQSSDQVEPLTLSE